MNDRKILLAFLKKLDSNSSPVVLRPGFRPVLWILIAATLLTMYGYREEGTINTWVVIGVCLVVGCFVGGVSVASEAEKQWPILKPHINRSSLEAQIEEMDT